MTLNRDQLIKLLNLRGANTTRKPSTQFAVRMTCDNSCRPSHGDAAPSAAGRAGPWRFALPRLPVRCNLTRSRMSLFDVTTALTARAGCNMHLTIGCNGHDTVSLAMHSRRRACRFERMIPRVGTPSRKCQ
jgi:hypothetical protein